MVQERADPTGPTPPPIRGTLEYHDHATGFRFRSDQIDFLEADETTARFGGAGTVGGAGGADFTVAVTEGGGGEPAAFRLEVVGDDGVPVYTSPGPGGVAGGHVTVAGGQDG